MQILSYPSIILLGVYSNSISYSQVVVVNTHMNSSVSRVIPLRNAGTIPLEVSLDVLQYADHFTVTPMQLMIEAGGQSQVVLKFHPKPHAGTKMDR